MTRRQKSRAFGPGTKAAILACLTAAATASLHAQGGPDDEKAMVASLPPALRSTVDQLGSLNEFKADDWRYHIGDLPHGESPTLDDSSWQVVQPKSEAPKEAVWYRRVITIPKSFNGYDTAGMRVTFRFNTGLKVETESRAAQDTPVPEIIYLDGRRVALGGDLEPVSLTDDAKPGQRILVAVKLLPTSEPKIFRRVELHFEYAKNRPNPSDVRAELLSATLLIPTLSKDQPADQATVAKAAAAIDFKALATAGPSGQKKFDNSLITAQQDLETLKPMLQQATFHLTGNSHIDAAWLWPWTETVDVVYRTFGSAAQLINEYPQYTYTQSAAQYNEWMADKYPELNDQIKKDINAGRWEVVGGMWVEPDLNLPDGESLVRSILIGKRYYEKEYGVDVHVGWNPDSFGYNWQLPQIYKKSGIDTFVTQKMAWNDTNQLPFKLFWWESPDGSKVLTYFPHGYGNTDLEPVRLSMDFATARKQAPACPPCWTSTAPATTEAAPPAPSSIRACTGLRATSPPPSSSSAWPRPTSTKCAPWSLPNRNLELRFARAGLYLSARRGCEPDRHSHLERRALPRVPPRRLHHPGPPQAQHAHQRRRGPQRREVRLARLARRQHLSQR